MSTNSSSIYKLNEKHQKNVVAIPKFAAFLDMILEEIEQIAISNHLKFAKDKLWACTELPSYIVVQSSNHLKLNLNSYIGDQLKLKQCPCLLFILNTSKHQFTSPDKLLCNMLELLKI